MRDRLIAALLAMMLLLSGCAAFSPEIDGEDIIEVFYYVPNLEGTAELPVAGYACDLRQDPVKSAIEQDPGTGAIEHDSGNGAIEHDSGGSAIEKALVLIKTPPTPEWIETIFPEDMEITVISVADGRATINFSERYIQSTPSDMAVMDYCLVRTVCGLNGFESVRLMVDGSRHPIYGDSDLDASSFVYDETMLEPQPVRLFIYFPSPSTGTLRRESHSVRITGGRSTEQYVLEELIGGPYSDDLLPAFPEGTELLSIYTERGVCVVNLNEDFIIGRTGTDSEINRAVYAVVNSLTELPGIESVRFLVSGEAVRYYHGIYMDEPLMRRVEYIAGS